MHKGHVTSAYRTISTVLVELPPIDLILSERSEIYYQMKSKPQIIAQNSADKTRIKKEGSYRLLQKWKFSWGRDDKVGGPTNLSRTWENGLTGRMMRLIFIVLRPSVVMGTLANAVENRKCIKNLF